ncbi:MAG: toll/interleukin-1 receptor domain-containing protein, partial [Dermatophilaceae bacterium]
EQLARQIKEHIETLGDVSIFLFQDHMEPGQESYDKVQKAIEEADALVALLTPNSTPSPDVNQEIGFSLGQKKLTVALVVPTASKDALAMLKPLDYIALDPENSLPGMTQLMRFVIAQRSNLQATPASRPLQPATSRDGTAIYGALELRLGGDDLIAALLLLGAVILIVYAMQKSS